jgi:hypothetical protein
MPDDLKVLVRRLRALAIRADSAARNLQGSNHAVMNASGTGMVSLAQIAACGRDFHTNFQNAFAALPAELRKALS